VRKKYCANFLDLEKQCVYGVSTVNIVMDWTTIISIIVTAVVTFGATQLGNRIADKKKMRYAIAEFYARLSNGRIDDKLKENMLKEIRANGFIDEAYDIEEKLRGGFTVDTTAARRAMDDLLKRVLET
jgi:hypothetical protein